MSASQLLSIRPYFCKIWKKGKMDYFVFSAKGSQVAHPIPSFWKYVDLQGIFGTHASSYDIGSLKGGLQHSCVEFLEMASGDPMRRIHVSGSQCRHLLHSKRSCLQKHELQMAALASTRQDICQTHQQTAEMNPSHSFIQKSCLAASEITRPDVESLT